MQPKTKRRIKITAAVIACFMLAGLSAIIFASCKVSIAASGRVYSSIADIPARKAALVLGCRRILPNGRENLYFRYRMAAVRDLFNAGKAKYILVSGDNSRKEYDETTDMRDALIEQGIPADRIVCDYAGFSTLDSVVRAKKVFLEDSLTVVSQEFHVRRAIYLGRANGVDVIGFPARNVTRRYSIRTNLREYLARVKAVLDVNILHRGPKYLGETIRIGEGG